MSSTIKFDDGSGTVINVYGPAGRTSVNHLPLYATGVNGNGDRWGYKYSSSKKYRWNMTLPNLTQAMKDDLEDFYYDSADGPKNTFGFTHTDGTLYNGCRFVNTSLEFSRVNDNEFSVTIIIEHNTQMS
jgi:hypothetical protein